MSNAAIAKTIGKFILKTFWPWFLKHVWPLIVEHVLKVVTAALESLSKSLRGLFDRRLGAREEEASRRAAAADGAAKAAQTDALRAENEAIARVWREVAEQFRQENEALKSRLSQVTKKAIDTAREGIEHGQPILTELQGAPILAIGGQESPLPALQYDKPTTEP